MERPEETSPERSARDRITEFFSWDTERYPEAHPIRISEIALSVPLGKYLVTCIFRL